MLNFLKVKYVLLLFLSNCNLNFTFDFIFLNFSKLSLGIFCPINFFISLTILSLISICCSSKFTLTLAFFSKLLILSVPAPLLLFLHYACQYIDAGNWYFPSNITFEGYFFKGSHSAIVIFWLPKSFPNDKSFSCIISSLFPDCSIILSYN